MISLEEQAADIVDPQQETVPTTEDKKRKLDSVVLYYYRRSDGTPVLEEQVLAEDCIQCPTVVWHESQPPKIGISGS